MSYLNLAPSNLSIWKSSRKNKNATLKFLNLQKFCKKMKMPKLGNKSALFGYFWAKLLKNYCHIWNQHPQICLFPKFREKKKQKKKQTKFWTKSVLIGFSALEFSKTIAIFEINTHKFVHLEKFSKKQKCLNLGQKVPDLGIFGLEL